VKALRKYKYVKLQRNRIPKGKGIMGSWMCLLSRAAFRKGNGSYCGFRNPVTPGMWAGGIVGLKSILGVKRRPHAMYTMARLEDFGYISYDRDLKTKKFTYKVKDYVQKYTGGACKDEDDNVYATEDYGFVFVPRDITQRLVDQGYVFEELDAWLDLWVHTVFRDYGNAFSFLAPAIQYGKYGSVLTLETLGIRWGWEKTKVWRFFKKFGEDFALYRLPGTYGCVICNLSYPCQTEITPPGKECVVRIWELIRIRARNTHTEGTDNQRINRFVAWRSREVAKRLEEEYRQNESGKSSVFRDGSENCVADLDTITRAYFSHGRNCKYSRNCIYDCSSRYIGEPESSEKWDIGALRPFWGNAFLHFNSS